MFNNSKRILSILMSVIMIVTSAVSAAVSSGAVEEITAAFESTSKETTGTYYHDDYTSAVHTTEPDTRPPSTEHTTHTSASTDFNTESPSRAEIITNVTSWVNPGDTITVTISGRNITGLTNANFVFTYDETVLEFISISKAANSAYDMGAGDKVTDGKVTWSLKYMEACTADQGIAVITFKTLKTTATQINYKITTWEGTEVPEDGEIYVSPIERTTAPETTAPETTAPEKGIFDYLRITYTDPMSDYSGYRISFCDISLSGDVVLPDFYHGYPIVEISSSAFANCDNITSITIGRFIKIIDEDAFDDCDNLESFIVHKDNQNYSNDEYGVLFNKYKTQLIKYPCGNKRTSYTIPDSVVKIFCDTPWGNAFKGCLNLKDITLGTNLAEIDDELFIDCINIENFHVRKGNMYYSDYDGVLFNQDKTTLVKYPLGNTKTEYHMPDSVVTINPYAFNSNNNLTNVIFSKNLTVIGSLAFENCKNITSVICGNNTTTIASSAFSYCENLTSVVIGNNVTTIENSAFYGCINLRNLTLGNNLREIGSNAFSGCSSLTDIIIPDSVILIDWYTFSDCTNLKNVTIGNGVTHIGRLAFKNCHSLENLSLGNSINTIDYGAFINCEKLLSVTIGYQVTSIDYSAFGYNSTTDTITEGFTIYGYTGSAAEEYADMYGITFISLGTYNPPIQDDELLKYLSYEIVDGEVWITDCDESISGDIVIPDRIYNHPVIGIGESAFQYCTNLRSVKIGRYLTHFSAVAFYGCSSLESFTVNGLNTEFTTDEYGVLFNKARTVLVKYPNGSSRTSYSIPDSVTELGTQSFSNANNLVNVTFGINVKELLGGVFADCNGIESITLNGQIDIIGPSSFSKCSNLTSVIIGDSVTAIAQGAFSGCKKLKNLTFGNNIKIIDMVAFTGCESLTNLTIPDSVTQIGASAFSKCTNLKTVTLGNGIKTIGYNAFGGCTNLENLTLGNSVITIDSEAFNACKNLLSVTIGPQVTTIGENAFGTYYNSATGETELVNGFTIYGYTGTEAEAYAKRYGINFVSLGVIEKEELEIDDSSITVDIDNLIATIIPGKTADEIAAMIKNEKFRIIDIYGNEIHGNSAVGTGSTIQIENADGHITEYTVIVPADIDGNGKTTAADARLALRASARIDVLEDVYALAADVSNDGRVTAMDARTILRIAAELEKPNIGTESGTEAVAPDFDRLSELITLTSGNSFNRDKADTAYVIDNLILANILCPAYNAYFSRDSYQALGEGNKIADPLNKFSSGIGNYIYYHYYKMPAQNVKWICENIYNIEFDINYTSTGGNPWGNSYYYDGYIYAPYPQVGSGPWEDKTLIDSHTLLDDGKYEIIARYLESDNFGESFDYETSLIIHAEWKQIDGRYDWVFYSVNELRALY